MAEKRVDRGAVERPRLDVKQLLERYEPQIVSIAPRTVTPERLMRLLFTSVARTPKLAECSGASLIGSFLEVAALGLEVGIAGQAWILPFWNNRRSCNEATLIVGYRGFLTLMWRSELIASVEAEAVRDGDFFEWQKGTDGYLRHSRGADSEYGDLTHVYAIVRTTKGGVLWDVMTRDDVERIRSRSRAKDGGPWVTDYEEMAKKTVLRRIAKLAPLSIEAQRVVDLDEAGDRGEQAAMFRLGELPVEAGGEPVPAAPGAREQEEPEPEPEGGQEPEPEPSRAPRPERQARAVPPEPAPRARRQASQAARGGPQESSPEQPSRPASREGSWRPGGGEVAAVSAEEGEEEQGGPEEPKPASTASQRPQGARTCDLPGCRQPAVGIFEAGAACAAHERYFSAEES